VNIAKLPELLSAPGRSRTQTRSFTEDRRSPAKAFRKAAAYRRLARWSLLTRPHAESRGDYRPRIGEQMPPPPDYEVKSYSHFATHCSVTAKAQDKFTISLNGSDQLLLGPIYPAENVKKNPESSRQ
jgi:hypothetical protein